MKGMYERLYLNDHWGYRPHITKEMMKQMKQYSKSGKMPGGFGGFGGMR